MATSRASRSRRAATWVWGPWAYDHVRAGGSFFQVTPPSGKCSRWTYRGALPVAPWVVDRAERPIARLARARDDGSGCSAPPERTCVAGRSLHAKTRLPATIVRPRRRGGRRTGRRRAPRGDGRFTEGLVGARLRRDRGLRARVESRARSFSVPSNATRGSPSMVDSPPRECQSNGDPGVTGPKQLSAADGRRPSRAAGTARADRSRRGRFHERMTRMFHSRALGMLMPRWSYSVGTIEGARDAAVHEQRATRSPTSRTSIHHGSSACEIVDADERGKETRRQLTTARSEPWRAGRTSGIDDRRMKGSHHGASGSTFRAPGSRGIVGPPTESSPHGRLSRRRRGRRCPLRRHGRHDSQPRPLREPIQTLNFDRIAAKGRAQGMHTTRAVRRAAVDRHGPNLTATDAYHRVRDRLSGREWDRCVENGMLSEMLVGEGRRHLHDRQWM